MIFSAFLGSEAFGSGHSDSIKDSNLNMVNQIFIRCCQRLKWGLENFSGIQAISTLDLIETVLDILNKTIFSKIDGTKRETIWINILIELINMPITTKPYDPGKGMNK